MEEITLASIHSLIEEKTDKIFELIDRDRADCRARHTEIDRDIATIKTQNGNQNGKYADHETRMRQIEYRMYLAMGGLALIVFVLKYI